MIQRAIGDCLGVQVASVDEEVEEAERRKANELPLANVHHASHLLLPFLDDILLDFLLGLVLEPFVAVFILLVVAIAKLLFEPLLGRDEVGNLLETICGILDLGRPLALWHG